MIVFLALLAFRIAFTRFGSSLGPFRVGRVTSTAGAPLVIVFVKSGSRTLDPGADLTVLVVAMVVTLDEELEGGRERTALSEKKGKYWSMPKLRNSWSWAQLTRR